MRDATLSARLAEAEEVLRAIRSGEVDAVVVSGKQGPQVFTLDGADRAYRSLIESMNEGALTLTVERIILYANQSFSRMVGCAGEQVAGGSFERFVSPEDLLSVEALLRQTEEWGDKLLVHLIALDGQTLPAQISIRPLATSDSEDRTFAMVVTDLTEARHNEEMLRALSHRVVEAQESERRRVALELHDTVTQSLCAMLFRSQLLIRRLTPTDEGSMREAEMLGEMIGLAAGEVERISRDLRPGVLDQLGLFPVMEDTSRQFEERTGIAVSLSLPPLAGRLPPDMEITLYRVLQESLRNVEKHSHARSVIVRLDHDDGFFHLAIRDDGIGFDSKRKPAHTADMGGLGLLGMRERAIHMGGTLDISSRPQGGTRVELRLPTPPASAAP